MFENSSRKCKAQQADFFPQVVPFSIRNQLCINNSTNGWDENGEESYMFWHNTDGAMGLDDVGYYFCDLNGDGAPELIIGSVKLMYAEWPDIAYDVYASVDGEIIHLATSWERNRYYLCSDNSLLLTGSGGAGLTYWEKIAV